MKIKNSILFGITATLLLISCKEESERIIPESKGCILSSLKQYESQTFQTLTGNLYKDSQLSYLNGNLSEVVNYTRGTKDLIRKIGYVDGRVKTISFMDASNILKIRYTLNYQANSDLISSVDIRYEDISPAITETYIYTYNSDKKLTELKLYSNNNLMEKLLYFYSLDQGKEVVRVETYENSTSDPNHHYLYSKDEYHYDDKKTGEIHPAFAINLYHQNRLDLLLPRSKNNIVRYYHYRNTAEVGQVPVLSMTNSVSFDRQFNYNAEGYPVRIVETRKSGNQLNYQLTYSNCDN